jgi:hypothetical protein
MTIQSFGITERRFEDRRMPRDLQSPDDVYQDLVRIYERQEARKKSLSTDTQAVSRQSRQFDQAAPRRTPARPAAPKRPTQPARIPWAAQIDILRRKLQLLEL